MVKIIKLTQKPKNWDKVVNHPVQSWSWGEFREKIGTKIVRYGVFEKDKLKIGVQVTIHKIPWINKYIGYYPKGTEITPIVEKILKQIAKENKCIYIKCEPLIEVDSLDQKEIMKSKEWVRGKALFTTYNFVLDLDKSEGELLAQMKQKTRYNIRLAKRRGVKVKIDNSQLAFEKYLKLTKETTKRQGFYAHTEKYHRIMWKVLHKAGIAELWTAKYKQEIITTWILFKYKDTVYYPYGASTRKYRNLMANNLLMWEVIKSAKKRGFRYLDMWGALGPKASPDHPRYGFHRFKLGYKPRLITYIGSWDYVSQPKLYYPLRIFEWIRSKWLKLRLKFK